MRGCGGAGRARGAHSFVGTAECGRAATAALGRGESLPPLRSAPVAVAGRCACARSRRGTVGGCGAMPSLPPLPPSTAARERLGVGASAEDGEARRPARPMGWIGSSVSCQGRHVSHTLLLRGTVGMISWLERGRGEAGLPEVQAWRPPGRCRPAGWRRY